MKKSYTSNGGMFSKMSAVKESGPTFGGTVYVVIQLYSFDGVVCAGNIVILSKLSVLFIRTFLNDLRSKD